jgi:protein involved in polysaccharide export with SLBB domain
LANQGQSNRISIAPPPGALQLVAYRDGWPEVKVLPLTFVDASRMEAAANYSKQTYRIEPGDSLSIRDPFLPEMNQEEIVRPDEKISAILVGEVSSAERTPADFSPSA